MILLFFKQLWTVVFLMILSALTIGLILLPFMLLAEVCEWVIWRFFIKKNGVGDYKNFRKVRGGER